MQQDKLIEELQSGNEKAFSRIYELYSQSTYGIIFGIIKDASVSEEVLQDVFVKIWNNASSYNPEKGRFFTWVLNIARNASIDKIRSKDFKNKKLNLKSDIFVDILESKSNFFGSIDAIGLQKYIDIHAQAGENGPKVRVLLDRSHAFYFDFFATQYYCIVITSIISLHILMHSSSLFFNFFFLGK